MNTGKEIGKGAVLYDYLYCKGGAESLTLSLGKGIEDTDVWVAFRDRHAFPDGAVSSMRLCEIVPFFPRLRFRAWRTLSGLVLFRWYTRGIEDYEWVLFSGSNAPVAVQRRKSGRNLLYCHTPPRFAYDLYDFYLKSIPYWHRPFFRFLTGFVRWQYERAVSEMDCVISNSENVQRRLSEYLGVPSVVIHPPCDIANFKWLGDAGYFLSTARLEPFKRVDRVIEAFRKMPEKRLIVASGGSEDEALRRLASDCPNIEFVGWQSDADMRQLVGYATATVYVARDEDFGMSPVESMAAGKPVIGVAEGGLLETVVDGETGVLIGAECDVESLIEGVKSMEAERAECMRMACEQRAEQFSEERFHCRMHAIIEKTVAEVAARQ